MPLQHFKQYGIISRVTMSSRLKTTKRRDFCVVDYVGKNGNFIALFIVIVCAFALALFPSVF